jgi:hypothetical protein
MELQFSLTCQEFAQSTLHYNTHLVVSVPSVCISLLVTVPTADVPLPLGSRSVHVLQPQQLFNISIVLATPHALLVTSKTKSELSYDRRSDGQSVLVSGHHLGTATNFFSLP